MTDERYKSSKILLKKTSKLLYFLEIVTVVQSLSNDDYQSLSLSHYVLLLTSRNNSDDVNNCQTVQNISD